MMSSIALIQLFQNDQNNDRMYIKLHLMPYTAMGLKMQEIQCMTFSGAQTPSSVSPGDHDPNPQTECDLLAGRTQPFSEKEDHTLILTELQG